MGDPLIVLSIVVTSRAKMGKYVRDSDLARIVEIAQAFNPEEMGPRRIIQALGDLVSQAERNFHTTAMG